MHEWTTLVTKYTPEQYMFRYCPSILQVNSSAGTPISEQTGTFIRKHVINRCFWLSLDKLTLVMRDINPILPTDRAHAHITLE